MVIVLVAGCLLAAVYLAYGYWATQQLQTLQMLADADEHEQHRRNRRREATEQPRAGEGMRAEPKQRARR